MPRPLARALSLCWIALAGLSPAAAAAQGVLSSEASERVSGEGWLGFTNYDFLLHAVLVLGLAAVLGAIIAYHPRSLRRVDSVEEAEAPKIYVTYGVVGAVIGLMVVEFGLVVGFVVFGIGGLFRFRTTLPSAGNTGRLILVTLVGLSCGLDLPHLGVLTTVFGFGLLFLLDRTITYQIQVKNLDDEGIVEACTAYSAAIERRGGRVLREKKSFDKEQVALIFQAPARLLREDFERAFTEHVPEALRGVVDWEVE